MTRYVPPDFTEAQVRALTVLADGAWHDSRRASGSGRVLGTVAAELYRRGYLERAGESRTARPSNPGFRYRLNATGLLAAHALDNARRVTPAAYRGGMSFTANLSGHFADTSKHEQAAAIVRDAAGQLAALVDVGDTFSGSFSGPENAFTFPEVITTAPEPDAEASADGTDGGEAPA